VCCYEDKLSLILALPLAATLALHAATVRIVQTNAGDSVIADRSVTTKVGGEIRTSKSRTAPARVLRREQSRFHVTHRSFELMVTKTA